MAGNSLKILHVFSTFAIGGQQRRFAQIADGLAGFRHEITAMDGDYGAMSLLRHPERCNLRKISITKGGFLDSGNIGRLRRAIQEAQPDLVCTYNWGSLEAVISNRRGWLGERLVPHIHFEDGFGPDETASRQHLRRVLARRLFLRDAKIVVPSLVLEGVALKKWRLPAAQVQWQPNGVDLTIFGPSSVPHDRPLTVGYIGALRPEKNLARLLNVFRQLLTVHEGLKMRLLIAGEGPLRGELEGLARALGIEEQVVFTGATSAPERFYKDIDIFILTSDTEQMPISLLEAMACGLPVVATDVGDIAMMVADQNKAFVRALGSDPALTSALNDLAASPDLRQRMGQANRLKAEQNFGLAQMIGAYETLFREMVA